jgi:hypothetical protein
MTVRTHRALARAGDLELIKAFRHERSETAARVLIERFSPQLLRTVARVLGDHGADADDLLRLARHALPR